ncbi:hypothetical protein HDE_12653 [Halotydeus destructor]|nr:hypothetical protein HDE_12653 [Halotydeus destructor]
MPATTRYQWKLTKNSKKGSPETVVATPASTEDDTILDLSKEDPESMDNIEKNYDLLDFEESMYNEDLEYCLPKYLVSQDLSAGCPNAVRDNGLLDYEHTDITWVDDSNTDPMRMVDPKILSDRSKLKKIFTARFS